MIIKNADDKNADINHLKNLLNHPKATTEQKEKIEREIRMIGAGAKGEDGSAFQLEFYWGTSNNWAIIHDLRLEHNDHVAQIDHLLIDRFLNIWVCESKHFSEGIAIDDKGQFTAFYKGKAIGQPSPIEQNRRHIHLLQKMCNEGKIWMPTRIGITIKPIIKSLILVSKNARITLPKITKFEWLDEIIKVDQIKTNIDKNDMGILSLGKVIGPEILELFAKELAVMHKPITINWNAKFGLPEIIEETPKNQEKVEKKSKLICDKCNASVPFNVARFCWLNKAKFDNKILCRDCQNTTYGNQ